VSKKNCVVAPQTTDFVSTLCRVRAALPQMQIIYAYIEMRNDSAYIERVVGVRKRRTTAKPSIHDDSHTEKQEKSSSTHVTVTTTRTKGETRKKKKGPKASS